MDPSWNPSPGPKNGRQFSSESFQAYSDPDLVKLLRPDPSWNPSPGPKNGCQFSSESFQAYSDPNLVKLLKPDPSRNPSPGPKNGRQFSSESFQAYSDPNLVKLLRPEDPLFSYDDLMDLPPPKKTPFSYDILDLLPPRETLFGYDDVLDLPPPEDTVFSFYDVLDHPLAPNDPCPVNGGKDSSRLDRNHKEEKDISGTLRCITEMLMEDDDLEDMSQTIHNSVLHAAERSFSEVLHSGNPISPIHEETSSSSDDSIVWGSSNSDSGCTNKNDSFESAVACDPCVDQRSLLINALSLMQNQFTWKSELGIEETRTDPVNGNGRSFAAMDHSPNDLRRGRKNLCREDSDEEKTRTHKHLAVHAEESILHELFDDVLSLQDKNDDHRPHNSNGALANGMQNELGRALYGDPTFVKKGATRKKAADMRTLLMECMQCLANDDNRGATKLLNLIRSRSSPSGDGTQRLAHYFANSLEARMLGTGSKEHRALAGRNMSDPSVLKAYKMYASTFPLMELSHFFVIETIMEQAKKAKTLHIIHFGILYGIPLAPLIQRLSTRSGGPPKLHITGVDLVQAGLQPDARAKEAGRMLTELCERFNVPFEYDGIAKDWETVRVKEFKLDKEEVVVVNCSYLLMYMRDDELTKCSPRDAVLKLIRKINPDIFIHGVVNAGYSSPLFKSRFKDALHYFFTLFEMFDANLNRENEDRTVFEREVLGKKILNVIACEGQERVERPETIKQWQVRTLRAGFRQLPVNKEIMKEVRAKVKSSYPKDFFVDESYQWMTIGWKGRALSALSCWKAT